MTNTKTKPQLLDITNDNFRECDREMRLTMLAQIGDMNRLAISGGRVSGLRHGIELPVSNGYSVTVELDANDTYVVRRLFSRGTKVWLHGERTGVYCEQLGEVAYMASCFRDEWV